MASAPPLDGFPERWSSWLLERNRRSMRTALWIGLTLYPTFGILDYFMAPPSALPWLFSTRILFVLATGCLTFLIRTRIFDSHPYFFSSAYMLLASFGLSLMTVFMGGLASPYYAGLSLVVVAAGLLFVWPSSVV